MEQTTTCNTYTAAELGAAANMPAGAIMALARSNRPDPALCWLIALKLDDIAMGFAIQEEEAEFDDEAEEAGRKWEICDLARKDLRRPDRPGLFASDNPA